MLAFYRSTGREEYISFLGAHTQDGAVVAAVDAPFGPHIARVDRADRLLSSELTKQFGTRATRLSDWKHSFVRDQPR